MSFSSLSHIDPATRESNAELETFIAKELASKKNEAEERGQPWPAKNMFPITTAINVLFSDIQFDFNHTSAKAFFENDKLVCIPGNDINTFSGPRAKIIDLFNRGELFNYGCTAVKIL